MPTITPFDIDGHCLSVEFLDDKPCYIMADGVIHILTAAKAITVHDGISCVALACDRRAIVTGGEDGRVCRIDAHGEVIELASAGRKWINAVACGPQNSVAYSIERTLWAVMDNKTRFEYDCERFIEGLAFAPKGLRIASAHYNGVTLNWLGTDSAPTKLEWKGAHNAVSFSPDNRFVITAMQENALHGWRLSNSQHLRMSGYPAKVKNWSWSNRGKWLATSGAAAAIVWPFSSKEGPMGKAPLELGTRATNLVTAVACHPEEEAVAIGFDDGMILFVRFADSKEILLRRPGKGPITAMRWDKAGYRIAFGTETGDCGLIDISA